MTTVMVARAVARAPAACLRPIPYFTRPRSHCASHTIFRPWLPTVPLARSPGRSLRPPTLSVGQPSSGSRYASSSPARTVSDTILKLLPVSLKSEPGNQTTNVRQLFALAKPEKRSLLTAFGLLLVSSSVTMSVPLTFGKLIDFFSHGTRPDIIPDSVTPAAAAAAILAAFTIGAAANAGRVILMRSAAARIIARLRKATYASALRQDIEYLERIAGPGDVVSRLNADAYIVGDSWSLFEIFTTIDSQPLPG
ncbi:ABC transporter transmembrane region [Ceratobasidium sp. AG-Ba]|nr:ABC transporter transmembrane region [Ceratobasidium sp. AG-Ba]